MRHLILLYEWTQHNFLFVGWHMHNMLVQTRSRFFFFTDIFFSHFHPLLRFSAIFYIWRTFVSIIAFYIRQSLCWTWGFVMDYTFFYISRFNWSFRDARKAFVFFSTHSWISLIDFFLFCSLYFYYFLFVFVYENSWRRHIY